MSKRISNNKPRDYTGQKFGLLTFVKNTGRQRQANYIWELLCDCGKTCVKCAVDVVRGQTQSCGCFATQSKISRRLTHGMSTTPTYKSWNSMMGRCYSPSSYSYPRYGGRGIVVDVAWHDFMTFYQDMGDRPSGSEIDRIDNDGNYTKANCRWSTKHDNSRNRSTNKFLVINGVSRVVEDWAKIGKITPNGIRYRLSKGLSHEESVFGKLRK